MIPALQIIASSLIPAAATEATHSRTLAGSDNSHASGTVAPVPVASVNLAQASRAFSIVRAVPTTRAPRSASTRIVSSPNPELQPVTSIVRPASEIPSVTCSAVVP